jgi:hypothetical protein
VEPLENVKRSLIVIPNRSHLRFATLPNQNMIVTFDNGALFCTSFTGTTLIHLKQTIKSSCITFTSEDWLQINEHLEEFDPTQNTEKHFKLSNDVWIILCSTGSTFALIRREHAKGGRCSVKTFTLPYGEVAVLVRKTKEAVGTYVPVTSNPEPPPSYVPPRSAGYGAHIWERQDTVLLPNDDWMQQFVSSTQLPQM